jgi:deoxyxylulose-5-phosphate synthase
MGIDDHFVNQGTVAQLQHLCGIDVESIVNRVENLVKGESK